MKLRLADLLASGLALAAALLLLLALAHAAHASAAGAWQPLYGPWQNGGSVALDDNQHRLFTFGGDGTDMVRVMSLDGFPFPWSLFTVAGAPPAIRANGSLNYDSAHNRLIVFGGDTPVGTALNDVWALNLSGLPTWTNLTTTGPAPDPRSQFGSCYDPASGKLFVFGGLDSNSTTETNDLYALDLNASPPAWSMPAQSGDIPIGRSGAPLALDPVGNRIFLFGGNALDADWNDEYELDLSTFAWTTSPMSGVIPDPRSNHLCVWDRNSSKLMVWGGAASDDSIRAMDIGTREWSSLPWFIGPPQHWGPAVGVFDWTWDRVVVLAGQRGAEAFMFNKAAPTNYWYLTGPGSYSMGGSFVVDRAHGRAIAYGGTDWNGNYVINSFWQYAFTSPQGWNGINTGGIPPPSRTSHVAVWDDKHDRMLVIGGRDENGSNTNTVFALQDSADFMNWQQLAPTGTPPTPRIYSTGIYDPVGDRVLLYGGLDANNFRADLRQLSLTPSPAWTTLVTTGGPSGRGGASAIYDEPRHRMILFGGADSVTGNYMNDAWALNLPALTWTHLLPSGTPPIGRWRHNAVYDSRRSRMLVFGGRGTEGDSADVWELTLAPTTPVWTRLASVGYTPMYRSLAGAVYDSTGDRMLVYGGVSLIASNLAIGQQDLWGLQFSGGVASVSFSGAASVSMVGQPWPNPAHGGSRLAFALGRATDVRAAVYDVAGRRVRMLATGLQGAGPHELSWDGRDGAGRCSSSGLYFYRVQLDGRTESRKVVLAQ